MRRPSGVALAVASVTLLASVTACSGDSTDSGHDVVVTITEQGGSVSASPDLVSARVGEPITFTVDSDAADEIHVHSVPDHEFEVRPATGQTFTFSVSTPGTVEVESHGLDETICKLEIR